MATLDLDDFLDSELTRVYIAGRLREAKRVESTLTEHGIDYAIEIEPYSKRLLGIIPRVYQGAAFYVRSAQAAFARSALLATGLRVGIQTDEGA